MKNGCTFEYMIRQNISLKPYNTFGIDASASHFAIFKHVEELHAIFSQESLKSMPLLILGGGSNILFTQNFHGLVLKNELHGINIINETEESVFVQSAAGEVWHDFVLFAIQNNLGGIENLSLIPGSVGAAPMQNIGAYGVEIKDVFHQLDAFEIATGKIRTFSLQECAFGYRESVFKRALKNQFIITSVTFKLNKSPKLNTTYGAINDELQKMGVSDPTIRDVSNAVIAIRQSKLPNPAELGNAGSFFKNPVVPKMLFDELKKNHPTIPSYPADEHHVKLAAGWLIEQAGWKGKTQGNCGVHKNQALVLVNYGSASGSEIYALSEAVLQSVKKQFGVTLEREVNII